ncbi:MAG: DUF4358 domain-containing protein [Ruminococcus sp.]|nr:DUF4358 domain-containing protein [Ruminococcus sp.]
MRMGRYTALALAAISTVCICSSCADDLSTPEVSITAQSFADTLYRKIPLDAELKANAADTMALLMNVTGYTDAAGYAAAGTMPDMIAVFCAADSAGAEGIRSAMQTYVNEMAREYERYAPEQVPKLENAVIVSSGNYAVLCVSPDAKATREIVNEILKNGTSAAADLREPAAATTTTSTTTQSSTTTLSQETTTTTVTTPTQGENGVIPSQGDYEELGVVVRDGDTVYECYYYNDTYVTQYANAINTFAATLPATANVYTMIIPNSMGITLPDEYVDIVPSTNQKTAIEKLHAKLAGNVKPVSIYDTLRSHRTEYVYFRTDHHWTALGAYYAYDVLCGMTGRTATPLDAMTTKDFPGFLGTFYRDSNENPKLAANPDTVTVHYPKNMDAISLEYTDAEGTVHNWPLLSDVTDYTARMKYATFAGGDNPMVVTKNTALQDGSVCVIIKESYGNAIIPFLADSYETVYAFDYRYDWHDLTAFVAEHPNADVVFANNVSMIQSSYLVGKLAAYLS